jgi:hypothetical protein
MANNDFTKFVINNRASLGRTNNKGLTMPSEADKKRMAAHKIIEQRREEEEIERLYNLEMY